MYQIDSTNWIKGETVIGNPIPVSVKLLIILFQKHVVCPKDQNILAIMVLIFYCLSKAGMVLLITLYITYGCWYCTKTINISEGDYHYGKAFCLFLYFRRIIDYIDWLTGRVSSVRAADCHATDPGFNTRSRLNLARVWLSIPSHCG